MIIASVLAPANANWYELYYSSKLVYLTNCRNFVMFILALHSDHTALLVPNFETI